MAHALVLVHDGAPGRRERILGALLPAFSALDVSHDTLCLTSGREDVPELEGYDLLVVMGSEESAYDEQVEWLARERAFVTAAIDAGLPTLGICFGSQLLALIMGGTVARAARGEFGYVPLTTADPDLVPAGPWMQFHGDAFVPPAGTELATSDVCAQAFRAGTVFGVQFHPETTLDTFAAWEERWHEAGKTPRPDVDDIRAQIARYEQSTIQQCRQLISGFLATSVVG